VLSGYCADRDLAGRYTGEWKSNSSGNGGALHMTPAPAPDGTWKCEAGFTLDGAKITTATHEIKVQDSKLDVSYDFEVQGARLRSRMTGEWDGSGLFGHSGKPGFQPDAVACAAADRASEYHYGATGLH
jgi:hypothetical protein